MVKVIYGVHVIKNLMKNMMIEFHIEGTNTPVAIDVTKASKLASELDKQGKKWRLGNTL